MKHFEMTAAQAAEWCGVSRNTFVKFSEHYPDELPRLEIKPGKKPVIRFCEADVFSFIRKRIANQAPQQYQLAGLLLKVLKLDIARMVHRLNKSADIGATKFPLQMEMLLKAFMDLEPDYTLTQLEDALKDFEPVLTEELRPYVGDKSALLAEYIHHKIVSYMVNWGLLSVSHFEESSVLTAIFNYESTVNSQEATP